MRAIEPILASGIVVMLITIVLDDKQEGREMDKKHLADVLEDELVQKLMLGDENFLDELRKHISEKISPDDQRILSSIFKLVSQIKEDKTKEIKVLRDIVKQLQSKRICNTKPAREKHSEKYNAWVTELVEPMKEAL